MLTLFTYVYISLKIFQLCFVKTIHVNVWFMQISIWGVFPLKDIEVTGKKINWFSAAILNIEMKIANDRSKVYLDPNFRS